MELVIVTVLLLGLGAAWYLIRVLVPPPPPVGRIDEDYYWASRGNVQVVPVESGAFITYIAVTGAGYVRVIKPEYKSVTIGSPRC